MKCIIFLIVIAVSLSFSGCQPADNRQTQDTPTAPSASGQYDSLFREKAEVKYARHFEVAYHGNYKVVKTASQLNSWSGGESQQQTDVMVLVQRGTPVPPLEGALAQAEVVRIPVEKVAVNVTNAESFLQAMGLTHHIVAVGGLASYMDTIRESVISGRLGQVGYAWHQPPQMEVLLSRKPDVFFMQLANLDYQQHLGKCRELGIPTTPVFEWAEKDYLGRAEWIKYFSLFFNAEEAANRVFANVEHRVDSLKQLVQTLPEKPTAIWGYYAGKDRWWFNVNNVEAQLMKDAGLRDLLSDTNRPKDDSEEPITSEQLLEKGISATHWIIGDIHSAALPQPEFLNSFQAWRENNLYHNMKRSNMEANAYDWYGEAVVRPDIILADLIALTHPHLLPDHQLYFMDHFNKSMSLPIPKGKL